MNLDALKKSFMNCYTKDLCYPEVAQQWSSDNPSLGMCAITALIVNDLYGGEIGKTHVDDVSHYFNLINDKIIDLTASQFNHPIDYSDYKIAERKVMLSNGNTLDRYEKLKKRMAKM